MDSNTHNNLANSPEIQGLKHSNASNETLEVPNNVTPLQLTDDEVVLSMVHDQIVQDEEYLTHENILDGSEITPHMRAKVRSFLMLECEKQKFLRETCALACRYVDLFFLHKGKVYADQFQVMAIGCLVLASKLNEKRIPAISPIICKAAELAAWELSIARRLNYRLHPYTHITFAQGIMMAWNQFKTKSQLMQFPVHEEVKAMSFYEISDLVFMVIQSLKFDLEQLVVNLFYLLVRKAYLGGFKKLLELPENEVLPKIYCYDDMRQLFEQFLFCTGKKVKIQVDMGIYLLNFIAISHVLQKWNLETKMHVENIDQSAHLQTHPDKAYEITRKLANFRARGKKFTCKMIRKTLEEQQ